MYRVVTNLFCKQAINQPEMTFNSYHLALCEYDRRRATGAGVYIYEVATGRCLKSTYEDAANPKW